MTPLYPRLNKITMKDFYYVLLDTFVAKSFIDKESVFDEYILQ